MKPDLVSGDSNTRRLLLSRQPVHAETHALTAFRRERTISSPAMSKNVTPIADNPRALRPAAWTALACALIVAAGIAAYSNSFHGSFIFDDKAVIEQVAARQPWPVWHTLIGPRPVVQATLALNYFIGGSNETGYHVVNLCIHILAALALFGILRRTLLQCRLPNADCRMMTEKAPSTVKTSGQEHLSVGSAVIPQHSAIGNRQSEMASVLAFCAALLWVVHPLQTQAVTYVIQRMESLMGLFYLLTLYCFIRSASSPKPLLWHAAAVAACALGMGSKEVMVSAPVIVLLYDRSFIAGSFGEALRRRRWLYVGLAATWLILARSGVEAVGPHAISAGFQLQGVTPFQYARSEPGVILHYLALAFWPAGLCLDYGWPVAKGVGQIAPGALVIGGLLAATVWALVRRPKWGFVGAWFFLILAPTSSIMPIKDLAFEHRMYLPLAAVAAAVVLAAYLGWERLAGGGKGRHLPEQFLAAILILSAAVALGRATFLRNKEYATALSIWSDTARKAPRNARALNNLGMEWNREGRPMQAIACFDEALKRSPTDVDTYNNRALVLADMGRYELALRDYTRAIEINPDDAKAWFNRGLAHAALQQWDLAIGDYGQSIEIKPDDAGIWYSRGNLYVQLGSIEKALEDFDQAIKLKPDYYQAYNNRGWARGKAGQYQDALKDLNKAIENMPDDPVPYQGRARAYYGLKEYAKALADVERCEKLHGKVDPDFREAVMQAAGRAK
jgi:tetratricopeptide (TPR) repeat protein